MGSAVTDQPAPSAAEATHAHVICVAGVGPGDGRRLIELGVMELLARRARRVAVFRPIGRAGADPVVELLRERYRVTAPRELLYGYSYEQAAAIRASQGTDELVRLLVDRLRELSRRCDSILGPLDPGPREVPRTAWEAGRFPWGAGARSRPRCRRTRPSSPPLQAGSAAQGCRRAVRSGPGMSSPTVPATQASTEVRVVTGAARDRLSYPRPPRAGVRRARSRAALPRGVA